MNQTTSEYRNYLDTKVKNIERAGIEPGEDLINPHLFEFQRRIVKWAIQRGRAAIFADCGLGKTLMQLAWADYITANTGCRALIVCPLAVSHQTEKEGDAFGIECKQSIEDDGSRIIVTNYERIDAFNIAEFGAIVIDESSILKSFDGKFRTKVIEYADSCPYRLACTATPAPNDHIELGNHAEFLSICTRQEMLASFFVHDSAGGTNSWRLKGHASDKFWQWVAGWAVAIRTPSDIGYSDEGYDLPEVKIHEHIISVDLSKDADGALFRMQANTLTEFRRESKRTAPMRAEHIAKMVNESDEQWIVWCHTNAEADELTRLIEDAVEVRGSDKPDVKVDRMLGFSEGRCRVLVTKPKIAGFGMNWQHCSNVAFVGLTHSYESFYQAIRRCWRFGQEKVVQVHVTIAETELKVLKSIKDKQMAADSMIDGMVTGTLSHGLGIGIDARMSYEQSLASGESYDLHLGDCVDVFSTLPDDSIGLSVFSPPFASLYTYSNSERDMGNVRDNEQFADHFAFLVPELMRTMMPGRLVAIHCMNLPATKFRDGHIGMRDFRGELIRIFETHGFIYHSEVTIWKDPVVAMQRTKAIGLLYKQLCKDSALSRQGIPDYLVVMRKPGVNPHPVAAPKKGVRFDSYIGENPPPTKDSDRRYGIDVWQRYASPVWFDINQTRTLQYTAAREDKDERHICPLQLDVIERTIELWSNPGDLVASPFAGIGSELVTALKMGRRAVGAELKKSYFDVASKNLRDAVCPPQLSLFE